MSRGTSREHTPMTHKEPFTGIIIEESLQDRTVLDRVKIVSTKIDKVTPHHQTPWITRWTLHTVEVPYHSARQIANEISKALDLAHGGSWYADFKNSTHHYIIFRNKVFFIDRTSKKQYDEAKAYGLSLGIPEHQVDFHPDIKEWKR